MRTHKFRGKDVDTGEWRYGDFYRIPAPPQCIGEPEPPKCYIVFENPNTFADWGMPRQMVQAEVIPETVGEFTGLLDKNGKEIYEGDIVKHKQYVNWGKLGECTGEITINPRSGAMVGTNSIGEEIEIIGNIWEVEGE